MLLIMCHTGEHFHAIDSRHVSVVLPRARLQRPAGSPPWLAGVLIYHAAAIPVVDLSQLSEGQPCPARLSSRIVVLRIGEGGITRRFGLLAEHVGLRECGGEADESGGEVAGPTALGSLRLDQHGVYQLIDLGRLIPEERQAVLFPAVERQS